MLVKKSKVKKIVITDIPRLDPITIYIEDFSDGQGQITIKCYTQVWTYYWGSMGEGSTMSSFFSSSDKWYLSNKLMPHDQQEETDTNATIKRIKKHILGFRIDERVSKEDMREYWDDTFKYGIVSLTDFRELEEWVTSINGEVGGERIFDDVPWHEFIETKSTIDMVRLRDMIIPAIQEALKEDVA